VTERIVAHIDPYTKGDTIVGILLASAMGYLGIDLNVRTCRANNWHPWAPWRRTIILMHWSQWWLHGYEPRPGHRVPRRKVENLFLYQVQQLQTKDHKARVLTAEQALDTCQARDLIPCFEMKPSIWRSGLLVKLGAHAVDRGWPAVLMTIQSYGRNARIRARWERAAYKRMAMAHGIPGLHTMLLYRHHLTPAEQHLWADVLDAVKGHDGWLDVVPVGRLLRELHKGAHQPA